MGNFAYCLGASQLDLIISLIKTTGCEKYLELGIWTGGHISEIHKYCNYCLGIDNVDRRNCFDYDFKLCTTDEFFQSNKEMFDIIFIDADHNFESVKKDFINSLKILNKFGLILMHDTDPMYQDYIVPEYCGDSYKIINWIEENYKDLNVITLPVHEAGLTIVNRKNDRRVLKYIKI
jgi:hypothetical protein